MIFIVLFWLSLGFIVYAYIGYPVILFLVSRIWRTKRKKDPFFQPTVSVIIAAYNEEQVLEEKIENCIAMDYPADCIEFLIGSDGSTDATNSILRQHESESIRSFFFQERRGKASVLNELVARAKGEVLVFSDANTMYRPDAVRRLMSPFIDPGIGGVCGRLILTPPGRDIGGRGEKAYWEFENRLKFFEGKIKTVLGANGAIYAIRKSLFQPLPQNMVITDDFLIPLHAVEMGYDFVYENTAVGREQTSPSVKDEFRRKVRIGAANFNALIQIAPLLNPRRGFVAFGLWSHKIIRWFIPFFLMILLVSNVFCPSAQLYTAFLYGQIIFYIFACVGWVLALIGIRTGGLGYITYFVVMHAALLVGFFKFLTGTQKPAWKRVDR